MNSLKILTDAECRNILQRIVATFGDGELDDTRYVFESITRVPKDYKEQKISQSALATFLAPDEEMFVVFDPHPKNRLFRYHLARSLGIDEEALGFKTSPAVFAQIFGAPDCDFIVSSSSEKLLAFGCHEDKWVNGERIIWCSLKM